MAQCGRWGNGAWPATCVKAKVVVAFGMKGGDNGKLQPKRKLPAQAGSDMMAAAIGNADLADDRRGQLERIREIEKRSLFGVGFRSSAFTLSKPCKTGHDYARSGAPFLWRK